MHRPRVAVYFVPRPGSALGRFGASVLDGSWRPDGYDAAAWAARVADPAVYGFHATIKAPFTPAEGIGVDAVVAALAKHAAAERAFTLAPPRLAAIGPFLALVESMQSAALAGLSARTVVALEPVRGPLTDADRAKRRVDQLPATARDRIERWGYPHVFEDFQFHMTLTGALPEHERGPVSAALTEAYTRAVPAEPLELDALTLLAQDSRERPFRALARVALGSGAIERIG